MNILIKKDIFQLGVSIVEKNTSRNLTLPILSNILLHTDKDKIYLSATNLESGVLVQLPSKGEIKTELTIPPRVLFGFINSLKEGNLEIKIDTKNNSVFIQQNALKTNIKGFNAKDFPILPQVNTKNFFIIAAQKLTKGLEQVINSVAVSDFKPELSGVLFSFYSDGLKLVATDTFRLSEKDIKQPNPNNIEDQFILPTRSALEVVRIFQNIEDDLYIFFDKNQIVLENKDANKINIKFISKIIEGDYPNYTQIIPQKFETTLVVPKQEFINHTKTAGLFSGRINDIKISATPNALVINTEDSDTGNYKSEIPTALNGPEKEISLNHKYLLDGLQNIEGDEVMLKINQQDSPILMQNTKHKDYTYLLMPIRS